MPALTQATLIKRYKRFLADVELDSGEVITIYCPNTGAMRSCSEPGGKAWFSTSQNPKRKYQHTWEIYEDLQGHKVAVNTHQANRLVEEAIFAGKIKELGQVNSLQREVVLPDISDAKKSRIDFVAETESGFVYIEVKSVTYLEKGMGYFPDAVTVRGQKHLKHLIELKRQGYRAILFFCVMHEGITKMQPAAHIDPQYAKLCEEAKKSGVEIVSYSCDFSHNEPKISKPVQVL